MYRVPVILCVIFFTTLLSSCGSKLLPDGVNKKTVTLPVTEFSRIEASPALHIEIVITPGAACSATLTATDDQIKRMTTQVSSNTLRISSKNSFSFTFNSDAPTLRIIMPSLSSIELSGANDAIIKDKIMGDTLNAALSGTCNLTIAQLNVNAFNAEISGTGNVTVDEGTINTSTYELSGAASIKSFNLKCKTVTLEISGTGSAEVFASEMLNAEISGAASVRYKGDAKVTEDISGVGSVKHVN